jgi:branched-subunit amino acid ABC-type transport system permease component
MVPAIPTQPSPIAHPNANMRSVDAGLLIGLVESLGGLLLDPSYKTLIVFGLYLAVVIFRPHGLFGRY